MAMDDPLPVPRPNVPIRAREEELRGWTHGRRFEGREVLLSRLGGARQVHVNLAVVPAGKQSGPFHFHLREEEHFYVLSGRCAAALGGRAIRVRRGRLRLLSGRDRCGPLLREPVRRGLLDADDRTARSSRDRRLPGQRQGEDPRARRRGQVAAIRARILGRGGRRRSDRGRPGPVGRVPTRPPALRETRFLNKIVQFPRIF